MKKRFYKIWILFLPNSAPKFWEWQRWISLHECLDPLIKLVKEKHSVEIHQFQDGKPINKNDLLWNTKNIDKWAHFSPVNASYCQNWTFSKVNIRCPSAAQCHKTNTPPDLFFTLVNVDFDENVKPLVSQFIIFAVASDLESLASELLSTIEKLVDLTKPVFAAEIISRWVTKKLILKQQL